MNLPKHTRTLAREGLDRLPIRWRARIKRWRGLSLSPIEQLALTHLYSLIAEHQSDQTEVLFWRGPAGRASIYTEAIIALSLRLRGISTRFVICDSALSGCIQRSIEDEQPIGEWRERCSQCVRYGVRILGDFGIPYVGISEFVSPDRQAEFRKTCNDLPPGDVTSYKHYGVPVGQFAESSALRYLKGQQLEGHEPILREYLYSALVCSEAARNVLNELKPSRLFMQRHIEYVGWAPAYVVLTEAGLPVTLWGGSLTGDRRITLKNVAGTDWSSLYSLTDEAWEQRSKQPLAKEEEEALDAILDGVEMPEELIEDTVHNLQRSATTYRTREMVLQELNVSDLKPIWCVFAHVTWDAGFSPEVMAFKNVFEWIVATVQAMMETESVTWLLKVHPAESRGTSRGVEESVKDRFPQAVQMIRFIPADSKITTKDLCSVLAGGVTLHGTVGVQLPARGIPVIVGERTHYAGKGFTCDGFAPGRYLELVHQAGNIPLLSERQCNLARRYAYPLYFQRRIPINMAQGQTGYAPLDPRRSHLLLPGNDAVMDMICDRIINGGEFML